MPKIKPIIKIAQPAPKSAAITGVVDRLNKKFGENAVIIGFPSSLVVERIPTGSLYINVDTGGGIPVGRYAEFSGEFSVTKTSQALHTLRNAQKLGLRCAFIDVENTTTREYAEAIGVNFADVLYANPSSLEEGCELVLEVQRENMIDFVVIDSVEAMSPNKEKVSDMDESVQMGLKPKLYNEFCRKFTMNNNARTRGGAKPFTVLALNQVRDVIGSYLPQQFTPGGRGKDNTSSLNIRLRKSDYIQDGKGENKRIVGQIVKYKVDKNKLGVRGRAGEVNFYFSENSRGVKPHHNDNISELIMSAAEYGIISRAGAWYTVDGVGKFNGINELVDKLRDREDVINSLLAALSARLGFTVSF
jgi:recombination protein RecA